MGLFKPVVDREAFHPHHIRIIDQANNWIVRDFPFASRYKGKMTNLLHNRQSRHPPPLSFVFAALHTSLIDR